MKAIWVRQPFAHLIAVGCKDVECALQPTSYRGPVLILAGEQSPAPADVRDAEQLCRGQGFVLPASYDLGGIVGAAQLADCVTSSQSPWFEPDRYGLVLTHARPVPFVPVSACDPLLDIEGFDYLWHYALASKPKASPIRKPSREWFAKFQARVDAAFAAQQL